MPKKTVWIIYGWYLYEDKTKMPACMLAICESQARVESFACDHDLKDYWTHECHLLEN